MGLDWGEGGSPLGSSLRSALQAEIWTNIGDTGVKCHEDANLVPEPVSPTSLDWELPDKPLSALRAAAGRPPIDLGGTKSTDNETHPKAP